MYLINNQCGAFSAITERMHGKAASAQSRIVQTSVHEDCLEL